MRISLITSFVCFFIISPLWGQEKAKNWVQQGEIHGNFQAEAQYYFEDTAIGATGVEELMGMNGFANVNYTNGNISAGFRYESYQNALQGFPEGYQGNGFPYRYFTYTGKNLNFTVGNFYEQFGNGFVFRTYEERGLGYDNVMDGIRIGYKVSPGIYLKGVIGQQRIFYELGEGIVRGADVEFSLNEMMKSMEDSYHRWTIGGSFVSKYQDDQRSDLNLPENVGTGGVRLNYKYKKFRLGGEYVYKINDPSLDNGFRYNPGEVIYFQTAWSMKSLGMNLSGMRVDNMSYKSERDMSGNNLLINYVPALTKQHTYNLLATIYPYATQLNGQVGGQYDITKKFRKKTFLGGKYGTTVKLNLSTYYDLDKTYIEDSNRTERNLEPEYTSTYNSVGDKFWSEINFELTKKFSKKFGLVFNYSYLEYNQNIIEGKTNPWELVYANIFVVDLTYRLNKKHALRMELQSLTTEQDKGDWATALIEYTYAPHWFIAVMDQYNYGNSHEDKRFHFYNIGGGYNKGGTRIGLSYGRQREGIFCVGGVCRNVPASNGFYLSVTHSF